MSADLLIASLVFAVGVLVGFGTTADNHSLALLIGGGAWLCLAAGMVAVRGREAAHLGHGSEEFSRLLRLGSRPHRLRKVLAEVAR